MKLIVDNLATEYLDEGEGKTILMLHGWADTMHTFDPLLKYITKYRIVRLDLPGFGGSERPKSTWGVEEYVRFVAAFCEKLNVDPEIIICHSFGGRVIIKGVGKGILRPKKIVLIASAGIAKQKNFKNKALRIAARAGKALTTVPPLSSYRQKIRKKLYGAIGSDYFASGSMSDIFVKVVGEDLLHYATNITVPTLLIWGRKDTFTPLAHGEKIHRAIKDSELTVIDGASHFVHQEHSQEVAELIHHFL
jgi:pimeloyl-ACP methyl ester carboxylesterase